MLLMTMMTFVLSLHLALAESLPAHNYSLQDGLDNLVVDEINQDSTGYLYFSTQHGVYFYDGRRFYNLGVAQGLPVGGFAVRIAFDATGRVLLLTPRQIFISDRSTDTCNSPLSLRFSAIETSRSVFLNHDFRRIVFLKNTAFIDDDGHLDTIDFGKRPYIVSHIPDEGKFKLLSKINDISGLFSNNDSLWISTDSGKIYTKDDLNIKIFDLPSAKEDPEWQGWSTNRAGIVYVASFKKIAAFENKKLLWIKDIPGDFWKHAMHVSEASILADRNENILVPYGSSIAFNKNGMWLPPLKFGGNEVQIFSMLLDKDSQLWIGTEGSGVYRLLGWKIWQNFNSDTDLDHSGNIWQILPYTDGSILALADHGMFLFSKNKNIKKIDDRNNYIGVVDEGGKIWHVVNDNKLESFSLNSEGGIDNRRYYDVPYVNAMTLGFSSKKMPVIWLATEKGLYFLFLDAANGSQLQPAIGPDEKPLTHVAALTKANDGSLWIVHHNELLHRHLDGTYTHIISQWPVNSFVPLTIAFRNKNEIWIGGAGGGLMRVIVDEDRVISVKQFSEPDILSSSVVSLLVDRRQWVWVGTDRGISVFDGQRWVSQNTNDGLIWNDISQDGLAEGVDGTIWISTSRGVSHLLKPESVFQHQTLRPVFSEVRLGNKLLPEQAVDFSRQPLTVRFGILNFAAQANVHFRYRLEDVDSAWADTASGEVRYAYVPPGQHNLTVQAYDTMRGDQSEPISLLIRMKYPWWQWWTAYIAYGLTIVACFYAVMRFRFRYLTRRQAILKELVEQRTKEMRAAQQALEVQAQQDGLTGLLNRRTIEANLSRLLARMRDQTRSGLSGTNVTAILMDIDYFKSINDEFGHLVGDEVLIEVSARLQKAVRLEDFVGRYGGEEFLITVSISGSEMRERIQEIMRKLTDLPISTRKGELAVRCSMGVAEAGTNEDWQSLIDRADQALYQAKAAGRNRIVFSELAPNGADYPG